VISCAYQPLLEPANLARLIAELRKSPVGLGNRPPLPMTMRAIAAAVTAFVQLAGRTNAAASRCEPMMVDLGRRSAIRGQSAPDLLRAFDIVTTNCLRRINDVIEPADPSISMRALQPRLRIYLPQLREAVALGHRQMADLLAMTPERRRIAVLHVLFKPVPVPPTVLRVAGISTTIDYVPVVWVDHRAPATLLHEPLALVAEDGSAALVPTEAVAAALAHPASATPARVVTGPSQCTPDISASLTLTQQAAAALRAGLITAPEPMTTCTDIAEQLLVNGSPALTEILIRKHLHRFATVRLERRLALAHVLLDWLENHRTYADLGAHFDLPRQTAHDQLKVAKSLIGSAVDDPQARAAIIVALRAAIAGWERDV